MEREPDPEIQEVIALLDMLARIYQLMELQKHLQKLSEQEFLEREEDDKNSDQN